MRLNPVEDCMKEWHQPEVVEQDVGMEVTSYLSAELDKT
jgi:coenzyme PQQ precursor peptide PqqA